MHFWPCCYIRWGCVIFHITLPESLLPVASLRARTSIWQVNSDMDWDQDYLTIFYQPGFYPRNVLIFAELQYRHKIWLGVIYTHILNDFLVGPQGFERKTFKEWTQLNWCKKRAWINKTSLWSFVQDGTGAAMEVANRLVLTIFSLRISLLNNRVYS